ncbi:MAG: nucleotidyltransferase family protein [Desulfobacterales bacterium]|nr:nucleotidyltransferase family protein [Desulfobacterales bacterium]
MNPKRPTAGIILAAGLSTRFGRPKQLMDLNGKPLIEWVVDACLSSRLDNIVVVLGHDARQIASNLSLRYNDRQVLTIINPQYKDGMSQSLRTGLANVMKDFPAVMFLLGDQPLVSSALIDQLLESFWESEKDICVPVYNGKRGNPTLFSSKFYQQLLNVSGDIGAREIIRAHPEAVLLVETKDPLPFFDIDTEKDLEELTAIMKNRNLE